MRLLRKAWKFFKHLKFYIHMVLAAVVAKVLFVKTGSIWYVLLIYGLYPFVVLNLFQGDDDEKSG
jgi:hypothetical protein